MREIHRKRDSLRNKKKIFTKEREETISNKTKARMMKEKTS